MLVFVSLLEPGRQGSQTRQSTDQSIYTMQNLGVVVESSTTATATTELLLLLLHLLQLPLLLLLLPLPGSNYVTGAKNCQQVSSADPQ